MMSGSILFFFYDYRKLIGLIIGEHCSPVDAVHH